MLVRYGEYVKALATKEGTSVADLNTSVVAALKKAVELDKENAPKLIEDRVHPGPGGQLIMAAALLKAWNAPALVSSVEIEPTGKVVHAANTKVENSNAEKPLAWTQLDQCLPMPIDLRNPIMALAVKASDVEQTLNQQTLKVSGLSAAKYQLKIDDKDVAKLTKEELAAGVNLALFDTPMMRQALVVYEQTRRHNDLHFLRWRVIQVPNERGGYPGLVKAIGGLDALEADLIAEQRAMAKPASHRFELVPQS